MDKKIKEIPLNPEENKPATISSEIKKAFQPGVSLRNRGCLYWILTLGFFVLIAVFWGFISDVFPSLERIYDIVGMICAGIVALFALFVFASMFWDKYIGSR